jgi:hypothetical protein
MLEIRFHGRRGASVEAYLRSAWEIFLYGTMFTNLTNDLGVKTMEMPDISHIKRPIPKEVPVKQDQNVQATLDAYDTVRRSDDKLLAYG